MKTNNKTNLLNLWQKVMNSVSSGVIESGAHTNLILQIKSNMEYPPYAWKRVPNVKNFRITKLYPYDKSLEKHTGVQIRSRRPEIDVELYRNKRINRYLDYQFKRLWLNLDNPRKFWVIGHQLLHSSKSYWVSIYHHVFPHWYKRQSYSEVIKYLEDFTKLDLNNYRYQTWQLSKGGGKYRTIGSPDPSWRLYLHGLNNLLVLWLSPYISPDQHGYYPGRGSATALRKLQEEVVESQEIYEFDLKSFFDTINLDYLSKVLLSVGLPQELVRLMVSWSRTSPYKGEIPQTWESLKEEAEVYKYHKTGQWGFPKGISELEWWLNRKRIEECETPEMIEKNYYMGVSQGSAVSPLLSTLLLTYPLLTHPSNRNLQYADDGIIYGDVVDLSVLDFPPESGVRVNEMKSGWVKRRGEWSTPLKFLGTAFIPEKYLTKPTPALTKGGIYVSQTRELKEYSFLEREGFQLAAMERYLKDHPESGYAGAVRTSQLPPIGEWSDVHLMYYNNNIISALHNGGFASDIEETDKTLRSIRNSWLDLEEYRRSKCIGNYIINGQAVNHPYTIYNVSSFAVWSLWWRIRFQQKTGAFRKRISPWLPKLNHEPADKATA